MAKKKVVKPTEKERRTIEGRLQKKYPQMYESAASASAHTLSKHYQKQLEGLSSEDRKELEKMVGKKLKKIYGG